MKGATVTAAALAVAITASLIGLALGSNPLPLPVVIEALVSYDASSSDHLVVVASRLPRVVLGLIVGAALGVSGALMQSLTRNPLGDPGILGVNAGASAAVVIAIAYLGVTGVAQYTWFAYLGAALAAVLVFLLGSAGRSAGPARIALAGTATGLSITALTQMVLISNETAFAQFRYWAVGSLQGRGFDVIAAIIPPVAIGLVGALALIGPLNSLALGDDTARALGTRVGATRIATAIVCVVLAGAATAAAGPIAFVGLAAAHIVRALSGDDHRWLIPGSIAVGAAVLVTADAIGRAIVAPSELQTGISAALLGSPVFIALVRSRKLAAR
ncbi:MAG: FecCD family ABC transporter permease [Microbacterium gubbeenense]